MAGETILVVEDNSLNSKLAQVLLTKNGYNVLVAEDAETALNLLKTSRPALILMDLQLPGMDGLQLTQVLKSHADTKDIIIVALTAYAMKDDEEKALKSGCDGYITKPFDIHALPSLINDYLTKK